MSPDKTTISFYPAFVDAQVYVAMAAHMGLKSYSECEAEVLVHGRPNVLNQYEREMKRHEALARSNFTLNVD